MERLAIWYFGKSIIMVHTNDVYNKLVEDRSWLANKVLDTLNGWYMERGLFAQVRMIIPDFFSIFKNVNASFLFSQL